MGLVGGSSQELVSVVRITPFCKPWMAIWKGSHNPIPRGQQLARGINHWLTGMIIHKGEREWGRGEPCFFFGGEDNHFGLFLEGCVCYRIYRDGPERKEGLGGFSKFAGETSGAMELFTKLWHGKPQQNDGQKCCLFHIITEFLNHQQY